MCFGGQEKNEGRQLAKNEARGIEGAEDARMVRDIDDARDGEKTEPNGRY